jgi:NAD(P)-dependent dehydrogenase (short-subunit alcohol dehydrogenase family)
LAPSSRRSRLARPGCTAAPVLLLAAPRGGKNDSCTNIVVAGATGIIGSALARLLHARGDTLLLGGRSADDQGLMAAKAPATTTFRRRAPHCAKNATDRRGAAAALPVVTSARYPARP